MPKTRKLILNRIAAIRERDKGSFPGSKGFSKHAMRWSSLDVEGTHIGDLDFSTLAPDQLLYIFEQIIRRLYTQM